MLKKTLLAGLALTIVAGTAWALDDKQAVRAMIERLHAENPEGSVLIQADRDAYSETLMAVMAAAREAKVGVSISAEAP